MTSPNTTLEAIYRTHHERRRGDFFLIHRDLRGDFLNRKIGKGKRILDIGCRDGALTSTYMDGNDVLGVDIDAVALKRGHERFGFETKHMDLGSAWDIPKESFDVVVAAEVLEHVYYPEEVIKKVCGVLRSEGIFLGSIPLLSFQSRIRLLFGTKKGTPLQDPTHINHFFPKEFFLLLSQHFKKVELVPIVSRKFFLFRLLTPFLFASGLLFCARDKI